MRALALALCLLAGPVWGGDWVVDPDASSIRFRYVINGEPGEGRFDRMEGEGAFDRAAPERTRFELRIPVDSLDLGNPVANLFALSSGWFDAMAHPVARYRLLRLTSDGNGGWEAHGELTIKGRTQALTTPIALDLGADAARASADMTFDRVAMGVGDAFVAPLVEIGRDVSVAVDLVARPAAP